MNIFFFNRFRVAIHVLLLLFFISSSNAYPREAISKETLPVLYVTFQGSFEKNMDYIQGNMVLVDVDGSKIELPAKFKTRGATALNYSMKPSFNMKLREIDGTEIDTSLCKLRTCSSWILDAMAIDRICMRNRVAFDLWNSFSKLPYTTDFDSRNGTVGRFVEVYVNDVYKGIYCLTDRINRKLLDLKKPEINADNNVTIRGVLYKQGTDDIGKQDATGFFLDPTVCVVDYHDAWELTEPEDYPSLKAWQPLLNAYDNNSSYTYVKEHYYIENLADYTLFIAVFSITDNWGNKNKYLSARNITKEDEKSRLVYTPWDLDTSFGGEPNGGAYGGNYSFWNFNDIIKSAPMPFSTVLSQGEFLQLLRDKWITARVGAFSVDSVAKRLFAYRDLFLNSGAWQRQTEWFDSQRYKPCYVNDLSTEIDYIVDWYKANVKMIDDYFGIDDLNSVNTIQNALGISSYDIYDSNGRKVSDEDWKKIAPALHKGIYICNGRKIAR